MSGLEVLAAVTSIVSAFNGSLSLYRSWRDKRGDRASDHQNYQLECSLYAGGTAIQEEYDRCYSSHGHRFASGDGSQLTSFPLFPRTFLTTQQMLLDYSCLSTLHTSNTPSILLRPNLGWRECRCRARSMSSPCPKLRDLGLWEFYKTNIYE